MNDIKMTEHFHRLYNKKRKGPQSVLDQVQNGIRALRNAEDPERVGELKKGRMAGTYGYKVNWDSRILYQVERSKQGCTVVLLRVCSHKSVYGRD